MAAPSQSRDIDQQWTPTRLMICPRLIPDPIPRAGAVGIGVQRGRRVLCVSDPPSTLWPLRIGGAFSMSMLLILGLTVPLLLMIGWSLAPLILLIWISLVPITLMAWAFFFRAPQEPLLVLDTARECLLAPLANTKVPLNQVVGVHVLTGTVHALTPATVTQGVLLVRRADGRRERLLFAIHRGRWPLPLVRALQDLLACGGVPVQWLFLPTPVSARDLVRPGSLASGTFTEPAKPSGGDPNAPAMLLEITPGRPACRNCSYSLVGLSDPPVCPECGTDFHARPFSRTR